MTAFHMSSNPSTAAQRLCNNPENTVGLSTPPQQGSIQNGLVLSEQYKPGLKAPIGQALRFDLASGSCRAKLQLGQHLKGFADGWEHSGKPS